MKHTCVNCGAAMQFIKSDSRFAYFDCKNPVTGTRDGKPFTEPCDTRAIVPLSAFSVFKPAK